MGCCPSERKGQNPTWRDSLLLDQIGHAPRERESFSGTWTREQARVLPDVARCRSLIGKKIVVPGHHAFLVLFVGWLIAILFAHTERPARSSWVTSSLHTAASPRAPAS